MYTAIIIVLAALAVLFIFLNPEYFKSKPFIFSLLTFCILGWLEFINLMRFPIKAWFFSDTSVIGFTILGVELEDILFCPIFSVIFYWVFMKTLPAFKQRVFNPTDKAIYLLVKSVFILVMYFLFSNFANYMALRMVIGLMCLFYTWNKTSFRHRLVFLPIVYFTGFFIDLPCVNYELWRYVTDTGLMCTVYSGYTVKLIKAVFPIEILFYYLSGAIVIYEIIAAWYIYFNNTRRFQCKEEN